MLFKIKAIHTIQLKPADFHNRYKEAIKIMLTNELQDKLNVKFGKVISVSIQDDAIFDKPLLLTQQGLALFKLQFEAVVERVVPKECTLGRLKNIIKLGEDYELQFSVGSFELSGFVKETVYEKNLTGDVLNVKDEIRDQYTILQKEIQGIQQFKIGDFYRLILHTMDSAHVVDQVAEPEDDAEYVEGENQVEDNEDDVFNDDGADSDFAEED
ncbi:RNA_polymerase II subunit RPB7 [Hexamita inflata]|uniref:RNA polymerase II subunit RPB7 n=1 Tax=Hexamita inflata TaxID=28002 RepID=A0AA86TML5_9EUKA|nr:RNA polymerase II subunit RPB7 [Hexamita inflata]CAI9952819.1 RNA polymerase II subunit RPB7 [Hexamita inflata]